VRRIDGHDFDQILDTLAYVRKRGDERPFCVIADTIKGRGVRRMELDKDWHVGNLMGADYDDVLAEIDAGLQPARSPA